MFVVKSLGRKRDYGKSQTFIQSIAESDGTDSFLRKIVVISSEDLARSLHPAWRLACYRANFQSMPRINILGAAVGAVDNLSLT